MNYFICQSPGLSGTTPITILHSAGLGWEQFEARMGVAIFGTCNLDEEGFEAAQYNPFHDKFHDNYVHGVGPTQEAAVADLKRDHHEMHESLWY